MNMETRDKWKIAGFFAVGFIAGALIITLVARVGWGDGPNRMPKNGDETPNTENSTSPNGGADTNRGMTTATTTDGVIGAEFATSTENGAEATLSVADQSPGDTVTIESVTLNVEGWVTVHEIANGHVSNALGAARRDAGSHTDVSVPLLRDTASSSEYVIVLYEDNGNGMFDIRGDLPVLNHAGEPVMEAFETTDGEE